MQSGNPSPFYFACRGNDINQVRKLLDEENFENLNKMEPNGSTALHAACYYGHVEIVKILLEKGFTRNVSNKYQKTPYEECNLETIKELFRRPKSSNRFGGDTSIEREQQKWLLIQSDEQYQPRSPDTYTGDRLLLGMFHGNEILNQLDSRMPKIDTIRRIFCRAIEEKDCRYLIRAYTAETDFYNQVDNYMMSSRDGNNHMLEFMKTIWHNRQLHADYSYQGKCYRSIKLRSANDLAHFQNGNRIMNRTFISTTKNRGFAEDYVRKRGADRNYTAMLSFEIRQHHTALNVKDLSDYPEEEEILIMSNSIFKVTNRTIQRNDYIEIELIESRRK